MSKETNPPDDTISLDEFIMEPGQQAAAEASAPAPAAKGPSGIDVVDGVLSVEDPEFSESMSKLKADGEGAAAATEIESLDLNQIIAQEQSQSVFRRGLRRLFELLDPVRRAKHAGAAAIELAKRLALGSRALLVAALGQLKAVISGFAAMSGKSKAMVGLVVVMGALAAGALKLTLAGKIAPKIGEPFIGSFVDLADASYTFAADEPMEDFNDPIFHPEHIVLFDRLVVNLKPTSDGANPMGLFELYIEASTHEGAVELKDRHAEARDVISRTLEQMPYEELVTVAGKNKMKIVLRKSLNELLTKGRIRRVFYKTAVLKA